MRLQHGRGVRAAHSIILRQYNGVDAKRVAIHGVSRLGKTALWAGASDERFGMVIASCSGEGGAAIARRNYGETLAHMAAPTRFPYQFAGNYAKYATRVNEWPVDANMLISLIAPRPLLLQTGNTDKWSDPYGEFLAAVAAGPVYRLLGKQGLETTQIPCPWRADSSRSGLLHARRRSRDGAVRLRCIYPVHEDALHAALSSGLIACSDRVF